MRGILMGCSLLVWAAFLLSPQITPADEVNPFIGTGAHGHTYPGATVPFGMVQLSPDTRLTGWDGCSGYHATDSVIYGFSHTHLSGTGISDYGDVLIMPRTGALLWSNGADGKAGYSSTFSKSTEFAEPGYYRVSLHGSECLAEMTASSRVGVHRYTFPNHEAPHLLVDLDHRDPLLDFELTWDGNALKGFRRSKEWADDQRVFFHAEFSRPVVSHRLHDSKTKIALFFDPMDEPLIVRVGLSCVDEAGALNNLRAEVRDWDFNRVRRAAKELWNELLGTVVIEGGAPVDRRIFYSALYHVFVAPNEFADVDGRYRGLDGGIRVAEDFLPHTVFSLWDTFRAAHPLYVLLQPERATQFIQTLLSHAETGGLLSMWELAGNYTGTMIGYHAVSVIADAAVKGVEGFDREEALEAMLRSATQKSLGIGPYQEFGYVPATDEPESVSKTLEYAYDDWCIAQFADSLGKQAVAEEFRERSRNYRNVFDPESKFMRAKLNQTWFSPFDPYEVNFHFTEANAWQYSTFVPHDISGLAELLGGFEGLNRRLDALFSADSEIQGRQQADITGLIGQYAHGNEPSHHVAYLYAYGQQVWKTQKLVRQVMDELYLDSPLGLSGNEDCGQMSAWYVFSALGFYPVTPGSDLYVFGSPRFPKAQVTLENGNHLTLVAENNQRQNVYIQEVYWDGVPWSKCFVRHEELLRGGTLRFVMGDKPHKAWGTGVGEYPVSEVRGGSRAPVPFVKSGQRAFLDSTSLSLGVASPTAKIHYELNGEHAVSTDSPVYESPISLDQTTSLSMLAIEEGQSPSAVVRAEFLRMPFERKIRLKTSFASQYSAGGEGALVDALRGGDDFRAGSWQGYEGVGIDAIVDLGEEMAIAKVGIGMLQEEDAWIFMPESVAFWGSRDGQEWTSFGRVQNTVAADAQGVVVRDFVIEAKAPPIRYIRVKAFNRGTCPPGHKGEGGNAWLFADEIFVETENR